MWQDVAAAAAVARVADSVALQVFANKFKHISIEFGGFNSNSNNNNKKKRRKKKKRNQRQDKT